MYSQVNYPLGHPDLPIPKQHIPPFLDHPAISFGASKSSNHDQSPLLHAQELDDLGDIPQGPNNFNPGELSSDKDNEVFHHLGLWNNEEEEDGDLRAGDDVPAKKEESPPNDSDKQDHMFMNNLVPLGKNFDYSDT